MSTRFARLGRHVAFRTWGGGPPDLLYFEEIPIDMLEDEPRLARWLKRMSSFGRVISFNPRGLGLSDPIEHSGAPTLDERLVDAVAVLYCLRLVVFEEWWHHRFVVRDLAVLERA